MQNSTRLTAIVLLFINGIGAIYGGGSMIYDPSGEFLQLPIELLESTPFDNFLIPGIILFSVNGVFNLVVAVLGIMRNKLFPSLTVLCGLLLVTWLTVQIAMIRSFYIPAHLPYYFVGFSMIYLGLKLRKQNMELETNNQLD